MSVRCIYIVPSHYAEAIQIDETKDMLIVSDNPQWQNYLPLRANFIHYIGNDHGVFEFARKVGVLSVRWQPLVALDVEVSGLNHVILHLALLAPLTLRCDDASFSEIHLTHGSEWFKPLFNEHQLPLIVLKADKHNGRIPNLPNLYHIKELHIDIVWNRHQKIPFDCLQLLPFLSLETLIIKGPINMSKTLTQLPLVELELHHVPDLREFPALNLFSKLEELTLCACETLGSQDLQQQAKALPDLMLYYMSTTDQSQWEQRGYIYDAQANAALAAAVSKHHLGDNIISIELDQLEEVASNTTAQETSDTEMESINDATKSLFERMRTESVADFFRNNKKENNITESNSNEPSLFERMRTESVTDFFRHNKTDTTTKETKASANEIETEATQEIETQQSLFQRMRTESVSEFFRNNKTAADTPLATETEATSETPADATPASDEEQQSLLTRMRTESVTDFFRNKRNK
ncbi:hypothetical protein [Vitreoscilla stercoraria]|uniref:Uncharacterized protein n=1 Tax=Vitreoscilla stercoraria TaxID=61 RepID=A0ABY4ECZ6_VITST|nr:hypothetical protein [Vitreoscilla stercoraria]UOO93171.1 hypothetical protein LVJ81_03825 [Vitreoscilla stercoraria]